MKIQKSQMDAQMSQMRVGRIVEWAPRHVKVSVYRDYSNGPNGIVDHGEREEIWLPKRLVAIVENPLATTMNNPNSTLQDFSAS